MLKRFLELTFRSKKTHVHLHAPSEISNTKQNTAVFLTRTQQNDFPRIKQGITLHRRHNRAHITEFY